MPPYRPIANLKVLRHVCVIREHLGCQHSAAESSGPNWFQIRVETWLQFREQFFFFALVKHLTEGDIYLVIKYN